MGRGDGVPLRQRERPGVLPQVRLSEKGPGPVFHGPGPSPGAGQKAGHGLRRGPGTAVETLQKDESLLKNTDRQRRESADVLLRGPHGGVRVLPPGLRRRSRGGGRGRRAPLLRRLLRGRTEPPGHPGGPGASGDPAGPAGVHPRGPRAL